MIKRYLHEQALKDLKRKMLFISGPRQCGKTTFAQSLGKERLQSEGRSPQYLNWDSLLDRDIIMRESFAGEQGMIIFDEIHKYAHWRRLLKGLYDKRKEELRILVTGSARLDYYRHGGDSLQGRYHHLRLLPFSFREVTHLGADSLDQLFRLGGFPEPFLSGSEDEARRWSLEYRARLIEEDLAGLERVSQVSLVQRLAFRLPDLVGSPLSINSLREDLEVSHQTIARWIDILERIYHLFRIPPFGSPKIRAVKKECKHYHYDWTLCRDAGARFENMVACHLFKECCFIEDSKGIARELRYFRDTDRREVDFVVVEDSNPLLFVECKFSDTKISPALRYLKNKFPTVPALQVVQQAQIDFTNSDGIRVCSAEKFLAELVV